MAPKAPRLSTHHTRNLSDPHSPYTAPSPRLDHHGVQTRAQAAREAKNKTPPPLDLAFIEDTDKEAPGTPLNQGIPPQTTSEPPNAPRKTKSRKTSQLSASAPVRKLDFDTHPFLAKSDPGKERTSGGKLPR